MNRFPIFLDRKTGPVTILGGWASGLRKARLGVASGAFYGLSGPTVRANAGAGARG